MYYCSFRIKGYKPLAYGDITELTINNFDRINILTGENGKGKSSLLRELTPYPATKSDYSKNGYKSLVLFHEGKTYTLTSDFSKPNVHSFLIDDVEQNISGTADVQYGLIEQYFSDYSKLIDKLVSGGCKFSIMSRNDRKQLLMSTYPSNLEFVLNKHKNLMTNIRSANSQAKLLKERALKLKEMFISDDVLEYHRKMKDLMNQALLALDKDIYAYEVSIKPYAESEDYTIPPSTTLEGLMKYRDAIHSSYLELIKSGYKAVTEEELNGLIVYYQMYIKNINNLIEEYRKKSADMVSDIEKYKEALSNNGAENLKQLKLDREVQMETIRKYPFNKDLDVVEEDAIRWWLENEEKLKYVGDLVNSSERMWTFEEFNHNTSELSVLKYKKENLQVTVTNLEKSLKLAEDKLSRYTSQSYPLDCTRSCKLRESISSIIKNATIERDALKDDYNKYNDELKLVKKAVDDLEKAITLRNTANQILRVFDSFFSTYSWSKFVLNGDSLINAVNNSIIDIINRMRRLIEYTREQKIVDEATDRLRIINIKIEAIENEHLPSKKILKHFLDQLESNLNDVTAEIEKQKKLLSDYTESHRQCTFHKELMSRIVKLREMFEEYSRKTITRTVVDFVKDEIKRMSEQKIKISELLRDTEAIVIEQDNLRTRLNDEIIPTQEDLSKKLFKWSYIEKELSPVTGLPKRIMTRYINGIFQRANQFISQVWNYQMELMPLKEEDDCDYTFPIMINSDGIVKDISICSKGQKEIIDLAIILAICTYRGYSSMYPLKLDEMSSGLSPDHNSKLFGFLGDLIERDGLIEQIFIVSHDPIINNGFEGAGYIALSDSSSSDMCKVISTIK